MKSNLSINFPQAVTLISTVGQHNTVLLQGAPGTGKSAILHALSERMPDYMPCYIDVANLDLGDLGMPMVDRDMGVTHYAPNARFGISPGQRKPVLLMLDELGKASRPVLNMLLPVILERRLGDVELPVGSVVFATTNLATDGVGDNIPAHAHNRMTVVDYANPTCDEWLTWASGASVVPEVMAFAKQYPSVFDRYDQLDDDKNPYIFNPLTGQTKAYCSPRSLAKASVLIQAREALGAALLPALAGTVGESAARDMEAMVNLADQLPSFESIVANPSKTKMPGSVSGWFLMAFMLAGRVQKETLPPVMEYVERWDNFEAKTLFVSTLASNAKKVGWACTVREFTQACAALGKFF